MSVSSPLTEFPRTSLITTGFQKDPVATDPTLSSLMRSNATFSVRGSVQCARRYPSLSGTLGNQRHPAPKVARAMIRGRGKAPRESVVSMRQGVVLKATSAIISTKAPSTRKAKARGKERAARSDRPPPHRVARANPPNKRQMSCAECSSRANANGVISARISTPNRQPRPRQEMTRQPAAIGPHLKARPSQRQARKVRRQARQCQPCVRHVP